MGFAKKIVDTALLAQALLLIIPHAKVALCAIIFVLNPQSEWKKLSTASGSFLTHVFGPMVHANLIPGEENSGKLVALVRNQAKLIAEERNMDIVIVDGAPGVGCPVISSITGVDYVVIVTEPTMSGLHDMKRAAELVRGFNIPSSLVINKWDIHPGMTYENRGIRQI